MPLAYRITRAPYADLSGEGARLAGGRWNHVDTPAVYAAENRALCLLELLVQVQPDPLPQDLVILTIEIPDEVPQTHWTSADLPPDWHAVGAAAAQDRGTAWLTSLHTAVLWLPSAVLPNENNAILNPRHPAHARARIVDQMPFTLDPRLLALLGAARRRS